MHLITCLLVICLSTAAYGAGNLQTMSAARPATLASASPAQAMNPTPPTSSAKAPAASPATKSLPTYSAVYQASYNGIPIEAHHTLATTDTGYQLITEAKNFLGRIKEAESFHLDTKGTIVPDQYIYDRSIFGKSRTETIAVDHRDKTSLTRRKNREYLLDFEPGQLGPLSHQVALGRDLRNNARELSYQVILRGHIKEYRYQRLGEEELDTALGRMNVVKVERVRDSDERETLLWLAPSLGYQPVKLLQKEDGETYEMSIKSFKLTGGNP